MVYNNNDLDTTTSTTDDKEVESSVATGVIADRVMPGVKSESVNMFIIGFKWCNCKKLRFQKLILYLVMVFNEEKSDESFLCDSFWQVQSTYCYILEKVLNMLVEL